MLSFVGLKLVGVHGSFLCLSDSFDEHVRDLKPTAKIVLDPQ